MKKIIDWIKAHQLFTAVSVILLVGFLFLIFGNKKDKNLASCLKSKGAKFYGASWCPHCKHQKSLFSNPESLPYIECSDANGKIIKECQDAGVSAFPTWVFSDGKKASGERTIAQLKQYSGC